MIQKIFDKDVDCFCNKEPQTCNGDCRCYCHIPKWYRNLVWNIQDIKGIGNILVTLFMFFFQPFMTIYQVFFCNKKQQIEEMK